jgi:hypothetical protein
MRFALVILLAMFLANASAQTPFPYELELDAVVIPELGGLQSYAVGQSNGKWLVIGGRLDGLHRRQPWATFDLDGHNNQLWVVDPIQKKKWTAKLTDLDSSLQEQLSSTNMEFFQKGNQLVLVGGYGYSARKDDHITFPYITLISVDEVIKAVINNESFSNHLQQVEDQQLALTGGKLCLLDNIYYLVGGHRFDGKYNPMDNPTFEQTYSNSVKRFVIKETHQGLKLLHYPSFKNDTLLHRRDFNVLPSIAAQTNKEELMAFSGVFQYDINVPYLTTVNITDEGINEKETFAQYYNHYHCATTALNDSLNNNMHYFFFGGIAHYYDSLGVLVGDNDVPFTKNVTHIVRDKNGNLAEYLTTLKMPGYLGAASEFIPNPSIEMYANGVIKMNSLSEDKVLLGYIFGGINSSAANIFWTNTGVESRASQMIYPVYLKKATQLKETLNLQSINGIQLQVVPDPIDKNITLMFTVKKEGAGSVLITNTKNKVVLSKKLKHLSSGKQTIVFKFRKQKAGDQVNVTFTYNNETVIQKLVIQ